MQKICGGVGGGWGEQVHDLTDLKNSLFGLKDKKERRDCKLKADIIF